MVVGAVEIQVRLEGCHSLKDKRHVIRSLMDRIRHDFHVAIAETGDHDLWGNACIGVACVTTDPRHAESILQHVIDAFDDYSSINVQSVSRSIDRL